MRYSSLILLPLYLVSCNNIDSRFEKKLSDHTGISFNNSLSYTEDFNPYTYRNFFNGGGVALGDINNDGLIDIYFTGNIVDNALYLNKGNWKFDDITDFAGVSCKDNWSTGATFVDINQDGLLDLYVTKSGKPGGENRHNELFINNGDLTFKESSSEYGLDIEGLSVHAAFFDYDGDLDLDAYVLNNSIRSVGSYDLIEGQRNIPSQDGNQLLENRNNKFENVSSDKGIFSSNIGFGLGITLSDFNGDLWPDLFISNDFFEKDYLYLNNNGNGFSEESLTYFDALSMGSMGADAADMDNDLIPDLIVTEMLPETLSRQKNKQVYESYDKFTLAGSKGYHKQYPRNALQRNLGNTFYEVGRQLGLSATEWSWAALLFDMDNDGYKDVYISNGIYKDLLDRDYLNYYANDEQISQILREGKEVITDLIDLMPSKAVTNSVFRNNGDFTFSDKRLDWGLNQPSFSNGSAYGDLDNDGDLDLVVNNVNSEAFIFENHSEVENHHFLSVILRDSGPNKFAIGAKAIAYLTDGNKIMIEQFPSRGFQSSVPYRLHFGLGKINSLDSLEIYWPDRKRSVIKDIQIDQILEIDRDNLQSESVDPKPTFIIKKTEGQQLIDFKHDENYYVDFDSERLLPHMFSNEGPCIANYDLNNDGIQDFYIGGAKGQTGQLFLSDTNGFKKVSKPFDLHKESEDVEAVFFDADNDGDQDLYVASGGKAYSTLSRTLNDRFYRNESGKFIYDSSALNFSKFFSTGAIAIGDANNDGLLDIFIGERFNVDTYGIPGSISLMINKGNGAFEATYPSEFQNIGMITDIEFIDLNSDEKGDLIVVGEWMPILAFLNDESSWLPISESIGLKETNGMWQSIETSDLNGDGIPDLVLGNMGQNGLYKPNMKLYLNDYDKNGKLEAIYTYKIDKEDFPIHDRDELIKQLPDLKKKLLYYQDYANQSIKDIFNETQISSSQVLEIKETRSLLFMSDSPLSYSKKLLPEEIQYSSVHAINISDINQDGFNDLILGGNQYLVKPQYGAFDASKGWILYGSDNSKIKFDKLLPLNIYGQIRDFSIVPSLKSSDSLLLITGISNSKIVTKYVK
ncbi:MAG: VCBS repeat-containing protein [Bacteroidota bacterium]|nr:VCBS repeat-containing protein [Bacteroidota bacterium]MED5269261.1 VCBS repeat-containing protein [Bacteroidota bacterium]